MIEGKIVFVIFKVGHLALHPHQSQEPFLLFFHQGSVCCVLCLDGICTNVFCKRCQRRLFVTILDRQRSLSIDLSISLNFEQSTAVAVASCPSFLGERRLIFVK